MRLWEPLKDERLRHAPRWRWVWNFLGFCLMCVVWWDGLIVLALHSKTKILFNWRIERWHKK